MPLHTNEARGSDSNYSRWCRAYARLGLGGAWPDKLLENPHGNHHKDGTHHDHLHAEGWREGQVTGQECRDAG